LHLLRWGRRPYLTRMPYLPCGQTIWAPVDKLLSFILTLNTRRNEFQADQYSVSQNYGPLLKVRRG